MPGDCTLRLKQRLLEAAHSRARSDSMCFQLTTLDPEIELERLYPTAHILLSVIMTVNPYSEAASAASNSTCIRIRS